MKDRGWQSINRLKSLEWIDEVRSTPFPKPWFELRLRRVTSYRLSIFLDGKVEKRKA